MGRRNESNSQVRVVEKPAPKKEPEKKTAEKPKKK
jgi:hypothetical protein